MQLFGIGKEKAGCETFYDDTYYLTLHLAASVFPISYIIWFYNISGFPQHHKAKPTDKSKLGRSVSIFVSYATFVLVFIVVYFAYVHLLEIKSIVSKVCTTEGHILSDQCLSMLISSHTWSFFQLISLLSIFGCVIFISHANYSESYPDFSGFYSMLAIMFICANSGRFSEMAPSVQVFLFVMIAA